MTDDDIPVVGQPAEIITWYPTALVHCKCQKPPTMAIVITTGFMNHSKCGYCGTHYWIKGLKTDGTILIDFLAEPPGGETVQ